MIIVEPTEFTSINEIKSNFNKYKEIYLKNKIIIFRNANLTKEEQTDLMIFLGDNIGWYPNSIHKDPSDYIEDHHKHMVGGRYAKKDELMLNWHTEHVQNEEDPFHGATWRMEKFDCPEDSGHTYFVDMTKMFYDLSQEDQDFISKCISEIQINESTYSANGEKTVREIKKSFDAVGFHPITKEKTLRVFLGDSYPENIDLLRFDGREPNQEEKDRHLALIRKICYDVWHNEDIRMVHKWRQGDLAVPDLYKLAHAVSGGFTENQRTLSGQFGKAKPWFRG